MKRLQEYVFSPNFFFLLSFQRRNENLALPSAEQQALESVKAGLETWEYTARNTLMYYPTGEVCKSQESDLSRWVDSRQCFIPLLTEQLLLVLLHCFFSVAQRCAAVRVFSTHPAPFLRSCFIASDCKAGLCSVTERDH